MKTDPRGFTMIEMFIVVAIVLILAAVAIPSLMKAKQAAHQAAAIGSLRTINTAEVVFASTYTSGFSSSLLALDGVLAPATAAAAGLIDSTLGSGMSSGYNIFYGPCPAPPAAVPASAFPPGALGGPCLWSNPLSIDTYEVAANPAGGVDHGDFYFTDQSAVIRANNSAPASPADSPLQSGGPIVTPGVGFGGK